VELVSLDLDSGELGVADPDLGRVAVLIQPGVDLQPGARGRSGDQVDDRLVAGQRLAAPVDRDVAEQAVLDPIPLRGAGRVIGSFR
jgi:hypothetical protein